MDIYLWTRRISARPERWSWSEDWRGYLSPEGLGDRGARIGADTSPLKDFRKGRVDSLAGMWVDEGTGWDRQSKWLNDASWPTERD